MAFLFRENRRHRTNGQTDGQNATLNEGRVITELIKKLPLSRNLPKLPLLLGLR